MPSITRRTAIGLGITAFAARKALSAPSLEESFRAAAEQFKIPKAAAMVATKDKVLARLSYGTRDAVSAVPAGTQSIFSIASMTKAITSAAAMQLVEQGRLNLDDAASKVLPELANLPVLEGFDSGGAPQLSKARYEVTLRQLLSHTAGFAYDIWDPAVRRYNNPEPGSPARPKMLYLLTKSGTRWEYGTNVDWVGRMVEAVSKQSLEAYFQDHIFKPLGMNDTSFILPPAKFDRLVSGGQRLDSGELKESERVQPPPPKAYNGGGGLYSTAEDYIRFTQMFLRRGQSEGGVRILKESTVAAMASNQIGELSAGKMRTSNSSLSSDVDFHPGVEDRFGLAFLINTKGYDGGRAAGSLAWAGLFNTFYWIDPKSGISAVILMQFLPFCDTRAVGMLRSFERAVYTSLSNLTRS